MKVFAPDYYAGFRCVAERLRLVDRAYDRITAGWDGRSVTDLAERARVFSNEVEYDDEKLEQLLTGA